MSYNADHPSNRRFHAILKGLGDLHDKKQEDYGTGEDPFANIRATSQWCCPSCHTPLPAWLGALIRLNDKVVRLQAFTRNGALANEGVVDSMGDIGVYAPIAQVMWEEEDNNKPKQEEARPWVCKPDGCPGHTTALGDCKLLSYGSKRRAQ